MCSPSYICLCWDAGLGNFQLWTKIIPWDFFEFQMLTRSEMLLCIFKSSYSRIYDVAQVSNKLSTPCIIEGM